MRSQAGPNGLEYLVQEGIPEEVAKEASNGDQIAEPRNITAA